jgi:KDO2-lipid IV(A) lauroyltransferase
MVKKLWYATVKTSLAILGFIMTRTPLWLNRCCMDAAFFCFYPLVRALLSYKKVLKKNLTMIYADSMTEWQIRRMADSCMRNIVRMPGDILYYGAPAHRGRLVKDISITGREHIERALEKGKGVIGLGAHMSNFLLLTVRLAQSDLPFVVLTKDPKNKVIREKLREWRNASGVTSIDVGVEDRGMSDIAKALEVNRLVYFIADERKIRNAMVVPFFGKPAYTAVGPAVFSKKNGAPIVPIFIAKRGGGIFIDIMPPIEDSLSGDEREDIRIITERANRAIEQYVRSYPDQWLWSRPRWKPDHRHKEGGDPVAALVEEETYEFGNS